jgi:hypothetical protein
MAIIRECIAFSISWSFAFLHLLLTVTLFQEIGIGPFVVLVPDYLSLLLYYCSSTWQPTLAKHIIKLISCKCYLKLHCFHDVLLFCCRSSAINVVIGFMHLRIPHYVGWWWSMLSLIVEVLETIMMRGGRDPSSQM